MSLTEHILNPWLNAMFEEAQKRRASITSEEFNAAKDRIARRYPQGVSIAEMSIELEIELKVRTICPGSGKPTRTNGDCDYCAAKYVVSEYRETEVAQNLTRILDGELPMPIMPSMTYGVAKAHAELHSSSKPVVDVWGSVQPLRESDVERLKVEFVPVGVDLGQDSASALLNELLRRMRDGRDAVLVEWKGTKIPRGAIIKGQPVGWTQNGMVTAANGLHLGSYERLVEWGGENHDEHKMIIYLAPDAAEPFAEERTPQVIPIPRLQIRL